MRPPHRPADSSPLNPWMELDGRYRILRVLGHGGMGFVYRARALRDEGAVRKGDVYAVKVMLPRVAANPKNLERFRRENLAARVLDNPHLLKVVADGVDAARGLEYLVMEFVEGVDLTRIVEIHHPLPVADVCELTRQAAEGLAYAHAQGAIHRDIKPQNLMLTREGVVKILDLGLAYFVHSYPADYISLTTTNHGFGSPAYGPPEQWRDAGSVGPTADIYSLGCTMFHLLAGKLPAPDPILRPNSRPFFNQVDDLVDSRPDVPTDLRNVIRRMGQQEPPDRFQTARELIEVLEPFCAGHHLPRLLPPPHEDVLDLAICYRRRRFHPLAKRLCDDLIAAGFHVCLSPTDPPQEGTDLADDDGNQAPQLVVAAAERDDEGIDEYSKGCILRLNRDDAGACLEWDYRYNDELRRLMHQLEQM